MLKFSGGQISNFIVAYDTLQTLSQRNSTQMKHSKHDSLHNNIHFCLNSILES